MSAWPRRKTAKSSGQQTPPYCEHHQLQFSIHGQIEQYLNELRNGPNGLDDIDPLSFWHKRCATYSVLAPIEDLIAAPASQAFVERIFRCVVGWPLVNEIVWHRNEKRGCSLNSMDVFSRTRNSSVITVLCGRISNASLLCVVVAWWLCNVSYFEYF